MNERNFLHSHPTKEFDLSLDIDHVIVDRKDWEKAWKYYNTPVKTMLENIIIESPVKPKKRYFIVYYRLIRVGGGLNNWHANIDTEGEYPSFNDIGTKIKDKLNIRIEKKDHKVGLIIPTSIIELNESDYNDWTKE